MTRTVATVITRLEGGAGVMALRGARAIGEHDHAVTLVTGSASARLRAEAEAAGLEVLIEPSLKATISPPHDALAISRLRKLFARRRFDVVHTHCAKAGAVGRIAAHHSSARRIVHTFHGFPFHDFQAMLRHRAYVGIERQLGRFTDVALCVGTGVAAEAVRRRLVPPDRVRTIGVTVDRDVPRCTPETRALARKKLGLPPSGLVVGTVGRLCFQKAPEDFIQAIGALGRHDVTGVWIGDGELADQVRRHAAQVAPARVVLAGDRADVPDLLAAFDVFAMSSRYEGLPLAVAEAMVCGVPVVATAVNAVPDLVVPGETGLLVPPGRPDLLAQAIDYFLSLPGKAAEMAWRARDRMDHRYDLRALGAALRVAYM